ncbi:ABC transporter ATP-binding protein [Salinicola corii]|uniref:ABC transporter ATP-binding protein n=1 Tax=Salinicola corii TaxID=2606937 RepID=A0A640WJD2_9GAMM|nr:ABC transporter ATP-binding protein [Salinicola corii]KAA0020687.1 ABC transporter ATP-binding protein [Salinicola corii]
MSFLTLDSLTKRYGDTTAVDALDLSIERGEFVSLLGPSGCGKTTTLQMIAGFALPSAGRIVMDGRDMTDLAPNARGFGIVFQSYALFPHMTVTENVGFGLEMRKIAAPERRRRIRQALALVRLDHLNDRYPRELSGGQRQRVALARALVIEPPLLLLDEPLSNLDAKLREEMQLELRNIQRNVGTTTLMVTHDQGEALSMSDRVVVMDQGRAMQIAEPFRAYEEPADIFVSTFVGKTNLLEGQVAAGDNGQPCVDLVGQRLDLSGAGVVGAGPVRVSIRPERLEMTACRQGLVDGKVQTRQFVGDHWLYQIDTPVGLLLATCPNCGPAGFDVGDEVGVRWTPDSMRLLQDRPRTTLSVGGVS